MTEDNTLIGDVNKDAVAKDVHTDKAIDFGAHVLGDIVTTRPHQGCRHIKGLTTEGDYTI